MKFLATLPPKENYSPISSPTEGVWLFEDRSTPALRIKSPTPNPWGKQWVILPSEMQQKADRSQYPYRLVLKLFESGEGAIATTLEREEIKGVFVGSRNQPMSFYAFPLEARSNISLWLIYSFHRKP